MKKILLKAPVSTRYVWVYLVWESRPWNYVFKEVKLLIHIELKFSNLFSKWQVACEYLGRQNPSH